MFNSSSAARTNLTSTTADIDFDDVLGQGTFRIVYSATYTCGNRNQQDAACKMFKYEYKSMEREFYEYDFKIADRAIQYAEEWNKFCDYNRTILISRGTVMEDDGDMFLVEPLISPYSKFVSNNGWIANNQQALAMEAFTHYTYHRSGGSLIVCDLQGRLRTPGQRHGRHRPRRFELSDPAICSRGRSYGPTDLGEKGIESFFCNHVCNDFCVEYGDNHWARPRNPQKWFVPSKNTSMMNSSCTPLLAITNAARFTPTLQPYYEDSDEDSDSIFY
jgi:Alpha-kinase family